MADDLSDALREIRELKKAVQRLQAARPLENASVTNGRLRIIGGTFQVDSGGSVIIVGTLSIDGTTTVTGTFKVTGPWRLEGNGTITGDVSITGNVTSTGTLTQNGALTQNGQWTLNGAGTIAGNVTQTGDTNQRGNVTVNSGGKITVQGGGGNVVLDSSFSAPRMQLGSAQIDGGASSFTFTVGAQVIYFFENTIRIPGMASKAASTVPGGFAGAVHVDAAGKFWRLT
ncbi:hypothetical protein [Microbacterium algeriense]|uniref:DUF342 domain-containing protein n=1 Tax=Microbacterium algeriense TaxID=2615184 RepID=A0ABQ6VAA4_9MICO|nr:hypothetical protein [Microbacterium algeriense]KAB1867342.1 hypothetical protein F6A08_06025 [Microbacterium algeriense]